MKLPQQITIPGTAPIPGPCDAARDAWLDACDAATEAAAEKRRKLAEFMDAMLDAGVSRVPVVDRKTKRRKWVELTQGEPRLRTRAAEVEGEEGAVRRGPRGSRRTEHEARENADPFAATSAGMAETPLGLPQAEHSAADSAPAVHDLRTPGQQRRSGRAKR